jgi:hypothetical protein
VLGLRAAPPLDVTQHRRGHRRPGIEGKEYPIGWVYERRNAKGGRSFGYVGGHFHDNFGIKAFRQAVVNGILWTAHVDIPEKGAPISIRPKDMELPPEAPKKK